MNNISETTQGESGEAANQTSIGKVFYHRDKVERYLDGDQIFPVTVDFHLTNRCSRQCPGCPSWLRTLKSQFSYEEILKFLSWISPDTKGLYLTGGGDPLLHPDFPRVISEAKEGLGFEDIAIVTNGNRLDNPAVQEAILKHATAVRVSLNSTNAKDYSDSFGVRGDLWDKVLSDTRRLVQKRNELGSNTEIGIATLTKEDTDRHELERFTEIGEELGVDWVHFRPYVEGWGTHDLRILSSKSVHQCLKRIEDQSRGVKVVVSHERYTGSSTELSFQKLYAPDFLMTVTADGKTYPGDEAFDLEEWNMGNILDYGSFEEYLNSPERQRIIDTSSDQYPFKGGLTRAQIISTQIQRAFDNGFSPLSVAKHPHIL